MMGSEETGVAEVTEEVASEQETTPEEMAELSDDDLDAAIAEEEVVETEEKPETKEGAETEKTSEEKPPVEEKPKEEVAEKTEEKPEEKPEEKSKEETEGKSEETDDSADLKERLAKAEKRLEDQDGYIKKRDNEVGELRKMVRKNLDTPKKSTTEEDGDGDELISKADASAETERALALAEFDQLEKGDADDDNRRAVREAVPDLDEILQEIVEVARKDGAEEAHVEAFLNDPTIFKKDVVVVMANRAREKMRNDKLEARIKELEEKQDAGKKSSTESLTKKINKAAKSGKPKVTAATGGAAPESKEVSPSQVSELSDEALDAAIKEGQV